VITSTRKENPLNRKSQLSKILYALIEGETVTAMKAVRCWNCYRLSARIFELIKDGWNIEKEMKPNKSGGYHAAYFIRSCRDNAKIKRGNK
jgi:hypothetical protein